MKIKYWYILAIGIIILDLVTKIVTEGIHMEVIPGVLSFVSAHNTGASFSMLDGARWLFIALGVAFVVGMVLFDIFSKAKFRYNGWYYVGFTLLLGGIIGNLIDRIALGYVRDFICLDFMNFPIFNIADCALCIGTACLAIWILFFATREAKKEDTSNE